MKTFALLLLIALVAGGVWWYLTIERAPARVAYAQDALEAIVKLQESREQLIGGTVSVGFGSTLSNLDGWTRHEDSHISASAQEFRAALNKEALLQRRINRFQGERSKPNSEIFEDFGNERARIDAELAIAIDGVATLPFEPQEREDIQTHTEREYRGYLARTQDIPEVGWFHQELSFADTLIFRFWWRLTQSDEPLPALPQTSSELGEQI